MSGDVTPRRIAYLSLQAVMDGQDTWAAVTEVIAGWEAVGWTVDRYFPDYGSDQAPSALRRLSEMWSIQRALRSRIAEYDAVYIRGHQLALPTARWARDANVPVVHECNGPYEDLFIAWPSTRVARPLFEWMQRTQYREAAAVISVADGLTRWLIEDTGNPHVSTNGNGANVDAFSPSAPRRPGLPDRYVVFFGQFPPWQGIRSLLEAVERPEWPEGLPLVFVGDGAMRPAVEEAAKRLPDRVTYLGRLHYEEVAGVAAHSVASFVPMLAPERAEMFSPLKLYESMACGVPVIASDTLGITEIVEDARCGILVTPGDAADIAAATARIEADPASAQAMGARGREAAVSRYSWRARADQRRSIVEDAIARADR